MRGQYRAPPPDGLLVAPLDAFTAVFHRASGITHLLTEPAPQILTILAAGPLSIDELFARLSVDFDVADADHPALQARLDELVAAGMIEAS